MSQRFAQMLLDHVAADAELVRDRLGLEVLELAQAEDFRAARWQFGDGRGQDAKALMAGDVRLAIRRPIGYIGQLTAIDMPFPDLALAQPIQRKVAGDAVKEGERILDDGALIQHGDLHIGLLDNVGRGVRGAHAPLHEAAQRLVVVLEDTQQRGRALHRWRIVLQPGSHPHVIRLRPSIDKNNYHFKARRGARPSVIVLLMVVVLLRGRVRLFVVFLRLWTRRLGAWLGHRARHFPRCLDMAFGLGLGARRLDVPFGLGLWTRRLHLLLRPGLLARCFRMSLLRLEPGRIIVRRLWRMLGELRLRMHRLRFGARRLWMVPRHRRNMCRRMRRGQGRMRVRRRGMHCAGREVRALHVRIVRLRRARRRSTGTWRARPGPLAGRWRTRAAVGVAEVMPVIDVYRAIDVAVIHHGTVHDIGVVVIDDRRPAAIVVPAP